MKLEEVKELNWRIKRHNEKLSCQINEYEKTYFKELNSLINNLHELKCLSYRAKDLKLTNLELENLVYNNQYLEWYGYFVIFDSAYQGEQKDILGRFINNYNEDITSSLIQEVRDIYKNKISDEDKGDFKGLIWYRYFSDLSYEYVEKTIFGYSD